MLLILCKGFLLSLSLCLDIGTVNMAIISTGLRAGAAAAFLVGLGSCFGDLAYAALSVSGVSALLVHPALRQAVWLGGSAVLFWFALRAAREAWRAAPLQGGQTRSDIALQQWSPRREFLRGIGLALASPSSLAWFAAVGGAVIAQATDGSAAANATFLSGFFLGGLSFSLAVALLIGGSKRAIAARANFWCHLVSALIFCYLAADVFWSGYR